nr:hypothetical protein [Polymorphobacter sp.]
MNGWQTVVIRILTTAIVGAALASTVFALILFAVSRELSLLLGVTFFGWLAALPVSLVAVAVAGPLVDRMTPPRQRGSAKAGLVIAAAGALVGAATMAVIWTHQAEGAGLGALYGGVIGGCWWFFSRASRTVRATP